MSQEELARLAGVSVRTVTRIETGGDYAEPRSTPAVRAALGLDDGLGDPPLTKASASQFAAELVRRLTLAEQIIEHERIRQGATPPDLGHRKNVVLGPPATQPGDERGAR